MTASRDKRPAAAGAPIIAGHWLRRLALEVATSEARPCVMVGIVASVEGEGTTTILVNLARVLEEELHRRVVVVDANLAAPGASGTP